MLFNSFIFVFGFLPITLVLTYGPNSSGRWPKFVLAILSLGFYAFWRPLDLPLLLGSIVFNYVIGEQIHEARAHDRSTACRSWLTIGVLGNLALLGYFKYGNFIVDNINAVTGADIVISKIALPLAISFFTFVAIAYLIDSARGEAKRMSFLDFGLFVTFFPKLIAGPIVHYKEMVPQLQSRRFGHLIWRNVLVGLVIFSIGLFKKTVIADTLANFTNPLFDMGGVHGKPYGLGSGWLCAITYTFQLYFDFSGYSDMAIGLARMFGVKLPLNFYSPLRAFSIIDYWRRWHMTLQRFIVAYVFQPLAIPLNRWAAQNGLKGWSAFFVGTGIPTFFAFVAIGAWHGAGWTFILFGALHALYVSINEIWRERRNRLRRAYRRVGRALPDPGAVERMAYRSLTLLAIAFANVLFRAPTVSSAASIWLGMIGLGTGSIVPGLGWLLIDCLILCTMIVFFMPNTQQIMDRFEPAFNWREWRTVAPAPFRWSWYPSLAGLAFASLILFIGTMFIQRGQETFLYFNF